MRCVGFYFMRCLNYPFVSRVCVSFFVMCMCVSNERANPRDNRSPNARNLRHRHCSSADWEQADRREIVFSVRGAQLNNFDNATIQSSYEIDRSLEHVLLLMPYERILAAQCLMFRFAALADNVVRRFFFSHSLGPYTEITGE